MQTSRGKPGGLLNFIGCFGVSHIKSRCGGETNHKETQDMAFEPKVEIVRSNFAPNTQAVVSCRGCGEYVAVHTLQGKRWLSDNLCTSCFGACVKWAQALGDLDKRFPVSATKFRKGKRWAAINAAWCATKSPLASTQTPEP